MHDPSCATVYSLTCIQCNSFKVAHTSVFGNVAVAAGAGAARYHKDQSTKQGALGFIPTRNTWPVLDC